MNASIVWQTSTSVKPSARKSKLRYMKKFFVWTDVDRLESMLTNYGVIAALLASIAFASLVSTTPEDFRTYASWYGLWNEPCISLAMNGCGSNDWAGRCTAAIPQTWEMWDPRVAEVSIYAALPNVTLFTCCRDAVTCAVGLADDMRKQFYVANSLATVLLICVILICFWSYLAIQASNIDKYVEEEALMLVGKLTPFVILIQLLFLIAIIGFGLGTYWLVRLKGMSHQHLIGPIFLLGCILFCVVAFVMLVSIADLNQKLEQKKKKPGQVGLQLSSSGL